MRFIAVLSVAAAVKVAHKSAHKSAGGTKMELIQAHTEVSTATSAGCMDWDDWGETDSNTQGCAWYVDNTDSCDSYNDMDFDASFYCCACGGGMPEWYEDMYY